MNFKQIDEGYGMDAHVLCGLCITGALFQGIALTPLVIRLANALGLVDMPGLRKVHRVPVPRIGGIAIALATFISFLLAAILFRWHSFAADIDHGTVLALFASGACVVILGFIDDVAGVRAQYKLIVLLGSAGIFCASGGLIRDVAFDGHVLFHLGAFAWPVTIIWMVGVTVSVNFIDGLDGLAAGIVAVAAAVLAAGATFGGTLPVILLPLALTGALMGFLIFNFNPAKIFMGDCGSLFIGFMLAGGCVLADRTSGTFRGLVLPALVLSIPLLDSISTLVRRGILQRRSLFAAERGHIHHRLLDVGLRHKHVVLLLYAVTLTAAMVAVVSIFGGVWATTLTACVFAVVLIKLFRRAGSVRARDTLVAVRRNRVIGRENRRYQAAFNDLQIGFREANTFDLWWQQVCKAAELLDFAKVNLPLNRRDGTRTIVRWPHDADELADNNSITAEVPIPQRRWGQTLRVEVEVIVSEFLESAGQRLALFSRLIGEFTLAQLPSKSAIRTEFPVTKPKPDAVSLLPNVRVAIVHDFLYTYAGAERVLEQLVLLFPQADIFSLFDFLPEKLRGFIGHKRVKTTFIQRMPMARRKHRVFLPLMPLAIEQLDVSAYDVVISSSYMVAKGVLIRPDQLHICYCHTPVRYAWDMQNRCLAQSGLIHGMKSVLARIVLHYIRNWDIRSANGVDVFLTNSDFVGHRIQKVYRRRAQTIYPPVDIDGFTLHNKKEDFYVTASRLVPYKRIDLIIDAFRELPDRRLFVIGEGPEMEKLVAKAGPNVHLIGYQSSDRLRQYLQRARAFIFAAEEDFGIAPVEAQACGTPVIAFGRGGATESVIHGQTGLLFNEQTVKSLTQAITDFEAREWDPALIRKNAERFSIPEFREKFSRIVKTEWAAHLAERIDKNRPAMEDIDLPMPAWSGQDEEPKMLAAVPSA
jgi:UDP-N-acetylmuramyl pentapeptide phosphotransferase/UDP-N-acetylglucosamine-1-phosphate transferase/glycosyltransferase involved in cell wall biosynthesis